ncbi:MAG: flagellar hook-length control protein FliK [Terriglobia bacterium]
MPRIVMNSPALVGTPIRTQSPPGSLLNEESRVLGEAQPDLLQNNAFKKEEIVQRGEVVETEDLITKAAEKRGEILQQEANSHQGPHDPQSGRDSLPFSDAPVAKQNTRLQAQETAESLPTAIKPGMAVNGGSHGIPDVEFRRISENTDRVPASRLAKTQNLPVEGLGAFVNGDGNHGQTNSIHSGTVGPNTYGASALDQFDRTNLISQLVEKIQVLSRERDSEIVVSLKPEFLGRISLKASMENDSLVTTLVAESTHAKSILESQLPALQQVLQDHGLPSAKVVVLHGNDFSFLGSGFGQPQPQQQSGSRTWNPSYQPDSTVNEINESKEASVPLLPSLMGFQPRALNVVV